MDSQTRNHHWMPQFYLRGFANEENMITVVDVKNRKKFTTSPRNIAAIRDFNRIDSHRADPNIIEKQMSKLEEQWAAVIREIQKQNTVPSALYRRFLGLIALLAVRNPQGREILRSLYPGVLEDTVKNIKKEDWEKLKSEKGL